jgi:hypothetical protein
VVETVVKTDYFILTNDKTHAIRVRVSPPRKVPWRERLRVRWAQRLHDWPCDHGAECPNDWPDW